MSRLEFKPQDRQSIDFAEEERIRFENNGKKDRAVVDASNLGAENIKSWKERLGIKNTEFVLLNYIQSPSNGAVLNFQEDISNYDEILTIILNANDGWYNYNLIPIFEVLNRNSLSNRVVHMISDHLFVNYYSVGKRQLVLPYIEGITQFVVYGVKRVGGM